MPEGSPAGGKEISAIGQLNEYTIHSELKARFGGEGAQLEHEVGGFVIDIVKAGLLIEIQTSNFSNIRDKLKSLLKDHRVRLVYPLTAEKQILVYDESFKTLLYKRRSPKKGSLFHLFEEAIYILPVLLDPNFSLEVLLTREEEIRVQDGRGSWRRRGISIHDRRLLGVLGTHVFSDREDYRALLPAPLPSRFTNRELSKIIMLPVSKIRKITYSMRHLGILRVVGKTGNAQVFSAV